MVVEVMHQLVVRLPLCRWAGERRMLAPTLCLTTAHSSLSERGPHRIHASFTPLHACHVVS